MFSGGNRTRVAVATATAVVSLLAPGAFAANQTSTLSPIVINPAPAFGLQVDAPLAFDATLPSLHSFAKATYFDPSVGRSRWVLLGGMTNGMHDLTGITGFDPAGFNVDAIVIDPVTRQSWRRSLAGASSGLGVAQLASLTTTNAQSTQQGSRLYVAGGYGTVTLPNGDIEYLTFDRLTSIDLPAMSEWVRTGAGSAAAAIRQISDPLFRVTGGEMATTANGRTHLVFGQDYPTAYEPRATGIYTNQVRSFTIVDDAAGLRVVDPIAHAPQDDFRRRDLNVVPIVRNEGGQPVQKLQALAGVFTPSFGAWTVPVTIDADGNAVQPDPSAPGTFKQGMNGYRSANIGLYSAASDTMHTLLFGGISYQYVDPVTGQIADDFNLPFISSASDLVTDANGAMTQYLLPSSFPAIVSADTGEPLLLGAETEFFLADGIPTYGNGVIDLDAITGRTLVGWLYGGIAAELANNGPTHASNAVFPVYLTPVPEPSLAVACLSLLLVRRTRATLKGTPL